MALVLDGDRPIASMARDLGVGEANLGNRVRQARIDRGDRPELTTAERAESVRLRRENAWLRMERDLLKRATVFWPARVLTAPPLAASARRAMGPRPMSRRCGSSLSQQQWAPRCVRGRGRRWIRAAIWWRRRGWFFDASFLSRVSFPAQYWAGRFEGSGRVVGASGPRRGSALRPSFATPEIKQADRAKPGAHLSLHKTQCDSGLRQPWWVHLRVDPRSIPLSATTAGSQGS